MAIDLMQMPTLLPVLGIQSPIFNWAQLYANMLTAQCLEKDIIPPARPSPPPLPPLQTPTKRKPV